MDGSIQDVQLAPESTALVIVDMENEFCKPGTERYLGPHVEQVVQRTAALLNRCRDAGVPVIYVRSVRDPNDPAFLRFGIQPHLIEGTSAAVIVEELAPLPGDRIVEKHTHDCFYNTEMDDTLARMGIRPETHHVLITGVSLTTCVYHAVLGFHVRHYYSVLMLDCTAGRRNELEEMTKARLAGPGYNYNVAFSTSDRLTFSPAKARA